MYSAGPLSYYHESWLGPFAIDNNGATKMFLFCEKNQESKATKLMSTYINVYMYKQCLYIVGTCVRENKEVSVEQARYYM